MLTCEKPSFGYFLSKIESFTSTSDFRRGVLINILVLFELLICLCRGMLKLNNPVSKVRDLLVDVLLLDLDLGGTFFRHAYKC